MTQFDFKKEYPELFKDCLRYRNNVRVFLGTTMVGDSSVSQSGELPLTIDEKTSEDLEAGSIRLRIGHRNFFNWYHLDPDGNPYAIPFIAVQAYIEVAGPAS